ncbi:MAG TPA: GNAT family protein [Pyrinomonadaceae bacterium]|jgi:ribosomal-protein-serine acetyltransferase
MFSHRIDDELELRLIDERQTDEGYALVMSNLEHLKRWSPWLTDDFSFEQAQKFPQTNRERLAEGMGFMMRLIYQSRIAGNIGFNTIDWTNRKTELGYWLGASFEGKGIVTRACRALVDYAFDELKLNRVEINCAVENQKSRRIPERLGFKHEGILRQAEWIHDHFHDLAMYAMLASEWKSQKQIQDLKRTEVSRTGAKQER